MKLVTKIYYFFLVTTICLATLSLINKTFMIWPQLSFYFTKHGAAPLNITNCTHYGCNVDDIFYIHYPRYFLVYIAFLFSKLTHIPFSKILHLQLSLLLSTSIFIQYSTKIHNRAIYFTSLFIANMSLAYLMNGRMIYVLCATSIIIFLIHNLKSIQMYKFIIYLSLSMLLANVSTGTSAIFFSYALILSSIIIYRRTLSIMSFLLLLSLVPWATYAWIGFAKNYQFFDGRINEFFKHGFGVYYFVAVILITALLVVISKRYFYILKSSLINPEMHKLYFFFIFISVAVSSLGISSITPALSITMYITVHAALKSTRIRLPSL